MMRKLVFLSMLAPLALSFAPVLSAKTAKLTAESFPAENGSTEKADQKSVSKNVAQYKLLSIEFESGASQVQVRLKATGGLLQARLEKLENPGRLYLDLARIEKAVDATLTQMSDGVMVPRVRLAQHDDHLRLIIDTVLKTFPNYTVEKDDQVLKLTFQKTVEQVQEAKSHQDLFLALKKNDADHQLKLGSSDEGGILFAEAASPESQPSGVSPLSGKAAGVRVNPQSGPQNRVTFVLDDRRAYKIFIEDSGAPIFIRKIRPVYELRGLQARLNQLGYSTGTEEGFFGAQTRAALQQFQRDQGLRPTGKINRRTQALLKNKFGY